MARILVVDDEPKMTSLICGALEDAGHVVQTSAKSAEALDLLGRHSFDIVVTDLSMPEVSGMTILEKARERGAEVIMMTAYGTAKTAVEAMKKGASDYLLKPISLEEIEILVRKIEEKQQLASLAGHYRQIVHGDLSSQIIGTSSATQKVKDMIARVAVTEATVLITGKSGTGKELAARAVHDNSKRSAKPFIAINCAALPETLLESELFGHEKGAFTGAVARKRGRFELAQGGTLFLDEIGEMPQSMQSKLLRVLEERKLLRVGGIDLIDIDVRLIAATNRHLKDELAGGRFREDLYFRLNVFPIHMPSLAERREDIPELADFILHRLSYVHPELSSAVLTHLKQYDWPGNIRELRNVLERATILARGEKLSVEDFPLEFESDNHPLVQVGKATSHSDSGLASAEREMILDALNKCGGNKTDAASLLKITRRRLYSRMKIHGIEP
jgi:two-component system, NtrC family, response regulator AtoC